MNKIFSFLAGSLCGALVGGTTALLLTPQSGEQLKDEVMARIEAAKAEAEAAKSSKRQELEAEYTRMKRGAL